MTLLICRTGFKEGPIDSCTVSHRYNGIIGIRTYSALYTELACGMLLCVKADVQKSPSTRRTPLRPQAQEYETLPM